MAQSMLFVETSVFAGQIRNLLTDEDFAGFQEHLAGHPEAGPVIQGTGGLRKVRWSLPGKGKSGGIRVIYLYLKTQCHIHLVFAFGKGQSDSLTDGQKQRLKQLVDAIRQEYTQ